MNHPTLQWKPSRMKMTVTP